MNNGLKFSCSVALSIFPDDMFSESIIALVRWRKRAPTEFLHGNQNRIVRLKETVSNSRTNSWGFTWSIEHAQFRVWCLCMRGFKSVFEGITKTILHHRPRRNIKHGTWKFVKKKITRNLFPLQWMIYWFVVDYCHCEFEGISVDIHSISFQFSSNFFSCFSTQFIGRFFMFQMVLMHFQSSKIAFFFVISTDVRNDYSVLLPTVYWTIYWHFVSNGFDVQ